MNDYIREYPSFSSDGELILAAVNHDYQIYNSNHDFKDNEEFILEALKINVKIFDLLPEKFKDDKKFILDALQYNGKIFDSLPNKKILNKKNLMVK